MRSADFGELHFTLHLPLFQSAIHIPQSAIEYPYLFPCTMINLLVYLQHHRATMPLWFIFIMEMKEHWKNYGSHNN